MPGSAFRSCVAVVMVSAAGIATTPGAQALDAYWQGQYSQTWGDGVHGSKSNWYTKKPLDGDPVGVPNDEAIFAPNALHEAPVVGGKQSIRSILFDQGDFKYSVNVAPSASLKVVGKGVTNLSSVNQSFYVGGNRRSRLIFRKKSVVGRAADKPSVDIFNALHGQTIFRDKAKGKNARIFNPNKGYLTFEDESSAGKMEIINNDENSVVRFFDKSTGGHSIVSNVAGKVSIAKIKSHYIKFGSFTNQGKLIVGKKIMNVSGNFVALPTSKIDVSIVSGMSFGAIVTDGRAKLGGKLIVRGKKSLAKPSSEYVVVLSTNDDIVGKFSKLKVKGFGKSPKPKLVYKKDVVNLKFPKK